MHADSPDESDLFVVDAEEETYTKVLPTATHTSSYCVVASTIEGGNNNRDRDCPVHVAHTPQRADHPGSHALGTHAHGVHFPASKSASTDDTIDDKSDAFPPHLHIGASVSHAEEAWHPREVEERGWERGASTDMAVVEDEDVVIERALCVTSEPCLLQGDGPSTLARAIRWPCATSASQVDSTAPDPLRFQDARTLSAISNVLAMMESRATASHRGGPLEDAIARALGYSVKWS